MQLRNVSKRLLGAAVMLLLPLHAMAQADEGVIDEPIQEYDPGAFVDEGPAEPDWIPSVRVGLGVNHQGVDSSLSTAPFVPSPSFANSPLTNTLFCPLDPSDGLRKCPEGIIRSGGGLSFIGPTDKGNPIDGPSLQGGFEIMGPSIDSIIWKPRPFFTLDFRDQLEGKTTTVRDQTKPGNNRLVTNPFTGSDIKVDSSPETRRIRAKGNVDQEFWLLAGLGTAFQLPIEGYNVKLKPSLNYFYSRTLVEAVMFQPVRISASAFSNNFPSTAEEDVVNHGIAPRIEVDAEIYRQGPLSVGFFLALDFLYILSGPVKHQLVANGCFGDAEPQFDCSRVNDPSRTGPADNPRFMGSGALVYDLERDRLTYQGTAGLRFSWMGGP